MEKATILVVEDDLEAMDIVVNHLNTLQNESNFDFDVYEANNGRKAVEIAQKEELSLILMDWKMPEMDGIDALIELKKSEETRQIPVIMTTAKSETKDLQEAFDLGVVDYVTKPIQGFELKKRVIYSLNFENSLQILHQKNEELHQKNKELDILSDRLKQKEEELKEKNKSLEEQIDFASDKIKHLSAQIRKSEGKELIVFFNDLKELMQLQESQLFKINLEKNLELEEASFVNLKAFSTISWDIQPRVNILLGRNGYGKSYLMRLLVALLQHDGERLSYFLKYSPDVSQEKPFQAKLKIRGHDKNKIHIKYNDRVFVEKEADLIGKVPLLAIPALRYLNKSRKNITASDDEYDKFPEDAAYHFLHDKPFEGLILNFLYQLSIYYLENKKSFDLDIFNILHEVFRELTGEQNFEFKEVISKGNARVEILVKTEGNDTLIPLQKASQGTLSVLAIFGLIYEFLKSIHNKKKSSASPHNSKVSPNLNPIQNTKAIVFIDEIDAHLHPEWQRLIVYLLKHHFPNVQFFLSAHSPLVVGGCENKEVSVLEKKQGLFTLNQMNQDFVGLSVKEILIDAFKMDRSSLVDKNFYIIKDQLLTYELDEEARDELIIKERQGEITTKEQKKLEELTKKLNSLQHLHKYLKRQSPLIRENEKDRKIASLMRELVELKKQINNDV